MWCVKECCGIACVIATYIILACVEAGFLYIGIWDQWKKADTYAYIHFTLFNLNMVLIFSSHIRCMCSEPGCLPLNYLKLNPRKLPDEVKDMLMAIKIEEEEDIDYLKSLRIEQLNAI